LAGCSDAVGTSPAVDAAAPATDTPADDAASTDVTADGGACEAPDAGPLQRKEHCDFAAIRALQHHGAAAEVRSTRAADAA